MALNILALGAGAGYMVLLAVAAAPRIPDVHRRGPNPAAEGGNLAGPIWAMLGLIALSAVIPAAVLAVGELLGHSLLQWAGVLLAAGLAVLVFWVGGRRGQLRLERRGPELLHQLRTGERSIETISAPVPPATSAFAPPVASGSPGKRALIGLSLGTGWIPLVGGVLALIEANPVGLLLIPTGIAIYAIALRAAIRERTQSHDR